MEDKEDETMLFHPQQVAVLKVALAVAIIKNKPQGVSAREYTERLALQFTALQKDWKEKANDLEMQLLQVRQQLVRCSLGASSSSIAHHGEGTGRPVVDSGFSVSQASSSFDPLRSVSLSSSVADASQMCDGCSGAQSSDEDDRHRLQAQQQHLLRNLHFLQNVSRLHAARRSEQPFCHSEKGASPLDSSHHVVMETVTKAVKGLASMCSDGGVVEGVSLKDLKDVVELALGLLQDTASGTEELKELFAACQQLARGMVDQIPHRVWENMAQWREMSCSLLPLFSSSVALSELIALDLVKLLQKCIRNMSNSEEDVTLFDPSVVYGAGEALSLLSHLFSCPKWPRTEKVNQEIQSLKESSYRVAASYPLFAYHVWKLDFVMQ